jgi:hypothetical protein
MNRNSLKLTERDAKRILEMHDRAWRSGKDRSYTVNSNLRFDFRWVSVGRNEDELQIGFEISISNEHLVVGEGFTQVELKEKQFTLSKENTTVDFEVI